METRANVRAMQHHEPMVKVEPLEDVKDDVDHDYFPPVSIEAPKTSLWAHLVKVVRYRYQKKHGQQMNAYLITKLLFLEVELLLQELSDFTRSCCHQSRPSKDATEVIQLSDQLSQVVTKGKQNNRITVKDFGAMPPAYRESIFGRLHKKEVDMMDVEQSMHSVFKDMEVDVVEIDMGANNHDNDDIDDANVRAIMSTAGHPEPTLIPGKEGGKVKTFYKCEKCNKSFPKRKRYYNHKLNGRCTVEPKWIRWHKNHKRVDCAHPDCSLKKGIDYTYPGLMKHIIDAHTVQEESTVQCPDCPLKFPLKAALKYHQEMAHQAHAKICQVCGKVVRDMRKHRLIHSGEKPFQCDRCSYRCARSSSLKRHMATHLNSFSRSGAVVSQGQDNVIIAQEGSQQQQQPVHDDHPPMPLPPVQKFEHQEHQSVHEQQQQQQQDYSNHPPIVGDGSSGFRF